MTPYQFANAECANNGKRKKCVLADNERCQYFEECVLPMVKWTTEPRKAQSFLEAVEIYNNLHKLQGTETKIRVCPGCGGELLPRKRYCPTCQIKRRKMNNRQHQVKWRSGSKQLSPESNVIS